MRFLSAFVFVLTFSLPTLAQSPCVDGGVGLISLQPTTLNFGSVRIGNTAKKTFQIHNTDPGTPMEVSFIGRNNSQFVILGAPAVPFCIGPQQAVTITIGFVPAQTGTVNAQILVQSTGGTGLVDVSGTGTSAGIPDIHVSPQSINLGDIPIGTFKQFTIKIFNQGNALLQVQPFVFDPCIRTIPNGPYSINPGHTQSLVVRMIACNTGPVSGKLHVQSNDPDQPSIFVQFNANGIKGTIGFVDRTKSAHLSSLKTRTTGTTWIDVNGDGLQDLFVTGSNGNMLFVNTGHGSFANKTTQSHLAGNGLDPAGASWADVDNDGDMDLFLADKSGHSGVYKNSKKGIFSLVGSALRSASGALAAQPSNGGIWFDYNDDGLIDLFVIRDHAPNSLYKNTGVFQFVDVTTSAELQFQGTSRSAVAGDFNGDGFVDLYVVNFQQPNKLYLNLKNGKFKDISAGSGSNISDSFSQVIMSDYDGDHDLDLFVINDEGPCVLLKNNGKAHFQNATAVSHLGQAKNATSAVFEDFDGDGDEDLIVLASSGKNLLFLNNGHGKFKKLNNVDLNAEQSPSSVATGDFNSDGSIDVLVGDLVAQVNSLFANVSGSSNWITVILEGTTSNRAAIGAQVLLHLGFMTPMKVVSSGNGQNQSSLQLKFGLGTATIVDTVQVTWPDGKMQSMQNVPANQVLKINE